MRFIAIIFCFLSSTLFFAQESNNQKVISDQFVNLYNNKDAKGIFALFSKDMKDALPQEKVTQVVNSLHYQVGKLNSKEFMKTENTYALYKADFEKSPLLLKISVDKNKKINGLLFKPYTDKKVPVLERNITKLKLPFNGKWNIFWGGETVKQNYHVEHENQKGAFDILIFDENGKSFKGDGTKNEDYYAFGKEIIAPCDAEVVLAVDGIKDNIPGELNPTFITGNTVILKTANNEYLLFAHFKQYSVSVKQGDKVKTGDVLGLCGNSGNSTETHLHFHIQNVEEMHNATGAKCYFDEILVNGEKKTDYLPVKNDVVENIKK